MTHWTLRSTQGAIHAGHRLAVLAFVLGMAVMALAFTLGAAAGFAV